MLTRLARWWLNRKQPTVRPALECTVCMGPADHTIIARFDDTIEAEVGSGGGGTGMSADYCKKHCPGGCVQGCATIAAAEQRR